MNFRNKLVIWIVISVYLGAILVVCSHLFSLYNSAKSSVNDQINTATTRSLSQVVDIRNFLQRVNPPIRKFVETQPAFFKHRPGDNDKQFLINTLTQRQFDKKRFDSIFQKQFTESELPYPISYSFVLYDYLLYSDWPEVQRSVIDSSTDKPVVIYETPFPDDPILYQSRFQVMGYSYICRYSLHVGFTSGAIHRTALHRIGADLVLYTCIFFLLTLLLYISIRLLRQQYNLSLLKDEILLRIKHELKTPVATLGISSKALINHIQNPDSEEFFYAHQVYKQQLKLEKIIQKITESQFLKDRAGKKIFAPLDTHEIIRETIQNLEALYPSAEVHLKLFAGVHYLHVDQVMLELVLINLFENAVKHNQNKPIIEISTESDGSRFLLSISDNGMGVPSSESNKIFGKLYKSKNSHHIPGLGIGLYTTRKIVRYFKGDIYLKSDGKNGSVFHVAFPIT